MRRKMRIFLAVAVTHFWLEVKWTAHRLVIDFEKVIVVLKETNTYRSFKSLYLATRQIRLSKTVNIYADNVDGHSMLLLSQKGKQVAAHVKKLLKQQGHRALAMGSGVFRTFWTSSGESVDMLRICWASCRLIPVMLEAAADCWDDWPLACAAAWLAVRETKKQYKRHFVGELGKTLVGMWVMWCDVIGHISDHTYVFLPYSACERTSNHLSPHDDDLSEVLGLKTATVSQSVAPTWQRVGSSHNWDLVHEDTI